MPLRIAFDIDGVLADMRGAFRREAVRLGIGPAAVDRKTEAESQGEVGVEAEGEKRGVSSEDAAPTDARLSARDHRRLWAEVETIENFWETLDELEPGSIRRLYALAVARRWEVLFITTRPPTAGDTAQRQSQRWLERRGFRFPSVYVISGSRGRVAAVLDLDIVVDDRPDNCLDVRADSHARAILVLPRIERASAPGRRVDARALHLGIGVVQSVRDCLDLLDSLGAVAGKSGRVTRSSLRQRLAERIGVRAGPSRSEQ